MTTIYSNATGSVDQNMRVGGLKELSSEDRLNALNVYSDEESNFQEEVDLARSFKITKGLIEVHDQETGRNLLVSTDKQRYVVGEIHADEIVVGNDEYRLAFRVYDFDSEDDMFHSVKGYFSFLTQR